MTNLRSASAPAGVSARNSKVQPGTVLFVGVLLVLLVSVLGLMYMPEHDSLYRIAPLQVLLGSTIFIALIALVVLVFARLGLYDRGAALGLPDGSVRALIALILLIIFIIFANVIFGQLSTMTTTRVATFSGLEEAQVFRLPGAIETKRLVPATQTQPASWEGTYLIKEPSRDAAALGAQIVTGLLTLVAAISAFYFGTGSVTAGAAAIRSSRRGGAGGLRVLRPSQPVGLTPASGGGYEPIEIELDGDALGAAGVTASVVTNDDAETVQRGVGDSQFIYAASSAAVHPVTLRFTSNDDEAATVDLVVRVPTGGVDDTGVDGPATGDASGGAGGPAEPSPQPVPGAIEAVPPVVEPVRPVGPVDAADNAEPGVLMPEAPDPTAPQETAGGDQAADDDQPR